MNIINRKKYYKYDVFLVFLFTVLPFVDAVNGFIVENKGIRGVGITYHFFITFILIVVAFVNKQPRAGLFFKLFIIFSLVLVIGVLLNIIFGVVPDNNSLSRVIKIIVTFVSILSLERYIQPNKIYVIKNILEIQCSLVTVLTAFANITSLGNKAYGNTGKVGFFVSTNEATIILTILSFYLLSKLYIRFSYKDIILLVLLGWCLISTASKAGLVTVLIILMLSFINYIKKVKRTFNKTLLILCFVIFVISIMFLPSFILQELSGFFARQNHLQSSYFASGESYLYYIFSGRIGRFNSLIFDPLGKLFSSEFIIENVHGVIQILFGFGLCNGYYNVFEMEIFDLFLYSGIIGWSIFVFFNIVLLLKTMVAQKNKCNVFAVIYVMTYSCLAGHVWTGGVSGIYFALFVVYLMKDKRIGIE